jgi:hypothetical protein
MIGFADSMKMFISIMDGQAKVNCAKNKAYIALRIALADAAEMRIDRCPKENFDEFKFDEVLV